jgi:hypothetical protein
MISGKKRNSLLHVNVGTTQTDRFTLKWKRVYPVPSGSLRRYMIASRTTFNSRLGIVVL